MPFQLQALPYAPFADLFQRTDEELAVRGAVRRTVDASPGYPCRVSLQDATIGETVILVHFEHHVTSSPFRASHAIYVREHATEARLAANEVPVMLRTRLLSLRAFDEAGMLRDADVVDGRALEPALDRLLADAAYVHVHFAKPGCFALGARRAP